MNGIASERRPPNVVDSDCAGVAAFDSRDDSPAAVSRSL
jgi:hypothetical protein